MSSEQEDGLPTAAIVDINAETGYPFADVTDYGYHLRKGDELVRRKDVAQLIQDKIQIVKDAKKKGYSVNTLGVFDDLLDEVNSQ